MTATFPKAGGSSGPETDPIAQPALATHIATQPAHGGDLAGAARPPTAHGHPQADVTGLAASLAAKADSAHTHPQADVTGLVAALAAKQDAATAATDAELAAATAGLWGIPNLRAGRYYVGPSSSASSAPSNGAIDYAPIILGRGNIDQLVVAINTAGEAGALIRLGLHADNAGLPGAVILDGGTVVGDTTGNKIATVALAITQAGLYWTAAHYTNAPTTRPATQRYTSQLWPVTQNSVFTGNTYPGYAIIGALVSTALASDPAITSAATAITRVQVRGA